uniref:hypothetical protein n=1 Tax=uncultured Fibrobacter sp. TaxID=261512 RepID=UPI0025E1D9B0
ALVATALVTITPFLITFEKGQDIVRGLLEYGIFAVLLFYLAMKRLVAFRYKWILLLGVYVLLVVISWIDLQTILFCKKQSIGSFIAIPLVTSLLAMLFLKDVKGVSVRYMSTILFISFFIHFGVLRILPSQPIFQFSIPLFLAQKQSYVDRSFLTDDFRAFHEATDSVTITKYYVDSSRSNVVVLVESWGIPMDSAMFAKELALLEGSIKDYGIHFRMYSRTRTAEREDLLDSAWRDSTGRRDSLFMPNRFASLGYKTSFLFGGDSTIQWRYKYIQNIGFQNAFWTDSATADVEMAAKIDSLLNLPDSVKQFIAWTTRDTRFPISDDPVECENLYYERLFGTLRIIADLAKKHPNVRFIVQGDHEPILSPLEFQAKFYRRWVPFVVLN